MDYHIEIKKLGEIKDSTHLVEIFNHHLIIYLKHGITTIKSVMVDDPLNELQSTLEDITLGIDINMTSDTYKFK